jgi:hypothetical protein
VESHSSQEAVVLDIVKTLAVAVIAVALVRSVGAMQELLGGDLPMTPLALDQLEGPKQVE